VACPRDQLLGVYYSLYTVYINDIVKASNFNAVLYANDINLHISGENHKILEKSYPRQWRSQPKNLGESKMLDFRRITLFCLEKRISRHKMAIFSKTFGGPRSLWPPLDTPMIHELKTLITGFVLTNYVSIIPKAIPCSWTTIAILILQFQSPNIKTKQLKISWRYTWLRT